MFRFCSTIVSFLKLERLSEDNRKHLKQLFSYFSAVDTIYLEERVFKGIRYNHSNKAYEFIINICKFIKDNLLIDEKGGGAVFYNFLEDERKMAYLFKNFVRNFYKKEQKPSKVYRENINWVLKGDNLNYLPIMQTDISIELPEKKIIMGTKYYKAALNINLGKEKLHSANLYLLFHFLKNFEGQNSKDKNIEGIFLYPSVNKDLDLTYTVENHIIKMCIVNLNIKRQSTEEGLLQIVS